MLWRRQVHLRGADVLRRSSTRASAAIAAAATATKPHASAITAAAHKLRIFAFPACAAQFRPSQWSPKQICCAASTYMCCEPFEFGRQASAWAPTTLGLSVSVLLLCSCSCRLVIVPIFYINIGTYWQW